VQKNPVHYYIDIGKWMKNNIIFIILYLFILKFILLDYEYTTISFVNMNSYIDKVEGWALLQGGRARKPDFIKSAGWVVNKGVVRYKISINQFSSPKCHNSKSIILIIGYRKFVQA